MSNRIRVGIATYHEVIDSLKDAEKWLIDVRDPKDLEDGQIPTSINIPCGFQYHTHDVCHYHTLLIIYFANFSGKNLRRTATISSCFFC